MAIPPDCKLHCPDDGICHHECEQACFRVLHASPLSAGLVYKGGVFTKWPDSMLARHERATTTTPSTEGAGSG